MEKNCYVDKTMFIWIVGLAFSIASIVVANSYANQNRIEGRVEKTEECILKMKEDIATIKANTEWLDKLRRNGEIQIKNETSMKMASTTKAQ